ncbi:MAG: S8 family serine peptidase [Myxococcota bacterium]
MSNSKHGFLVSAMLASAIVGLACTGLTGGTTPGGDDAGDHGGKHGKADSKKLRVGSSSLKKGGKADKIPTGATVERSRKKEEFVVKLAPGVRELDVGGGKVKTGDDRLDGAFGQLSLKESEKVHKEAPRKREVADGLGLGRTIRIRTAKSPEEVTKKLEASDSVEWVEPVSEVRNAGAPNDPYWQYQWHMQNIKVDKAWEITQGEGVVVAVVDTGVSANEDGFFKLLKGKDFVDGDNAPDDENGHGSHVAGTIGQASNNGIGTVGVAPKVSILPVRVLDANGSGSNTWVAEGIIWAVDNGANIINLSLGSPMNSEAVADAVAYAYENDVTVVAATGNDGFTDFIGFPAALETTIAVGSVDLKNTVAFYSNQGKQIDVVAPGGDTTADLNGDGQQDGVLQETRLEGVWAYHFLQGTSMATPHVAGCAALVYAHGTHDPDGIRELLTGTATDLGDKGWDTVYGAGLVNPVAALGAKAPRDSGRDRKAGGGDGNLTISRTRVKKAGESRAVIAWLTNEPAKTMVRGENGFERKDDNMTKVHQVSVRGKPGETIKFTIASAAGKDNRAKDEVEVTF